MIRSEKLSLCKESGFISNWENWYETFSRAILQALDFCLRKGTRVMVFLNAYALVLPFSSSMSLGK